MTGLIKGIQVVGNAPAADEIQRAATREKIRVWRINLSGINSRADLFDVIGKALSLPDYFARNWDSFEECLRDFDEREGWLIILDGADSLLGLPRRDLATLESILSDTVKYWSAEGRIFGVLFVGSSNLSEVLALASRQ